MATSHQMFLPEYFLRNSLNTLYMISAFHYAMLNRISYVTIRQHVSNIDLNVSSDIMNLEERRIWQFFKSSQAIMIHREESSIRISVRIRFTFREYEMHSTGMTIECLRVRSGSWRGAHQDATRVCSCTTRRVSFRPPGCPDFIVPGALITSKCFRRLYQIAAPGTGIALLFAGEGTMRKIQMTIQRQKERW